MRDTSTDAYTVMDEYRGYEYSILLKKWPNGWLIEVGLSGLGLPTRRIDDEVFKSDVEARECGDQLARTIIDDFISRSGGS